MAAEYDVFRRLGRPARREQVAADALTTRHAHEIAPVVGFADQVGAGGWIQDQVGAGQRVAIADRVGRPQVFADFDREAAFRRFRTAGSSTIANVPNCRRRWCARHPRRTRTSAFRRTRHSSAARDFGTAPSRRPRAATNAQLIRRPSASSHGAPTTSTACVPDVARTSDASASRDASSKGAGEEQVFAAVAGDRQLREQHDARPFGGQLVKLGGDAPRVFGRIGERDRGRGRSGAQIAEFGHVVHRRSVARMPTRRSVRVVVAAPRGCGLRTGESVDNGNSLDLSQHRERLK